MKTLLIVLALCGDVTKLACPTQTVAASLTSDDCIALPDMTRYDEWTFSGTVGQTITITMSATSFDTLLMLLDPSGKPVAVNDDASTTGTDSRLTFTLDATGTWTVIANSLSTSGSGSYVISADLGCPIVPGVRRRSVRR